MNDKFKFKRHMVSKNNENLFCSNDLIRNNKIEIEAKSLFLELADKSTTGVITGIEIFYANKEDSDENTLRYIEQLVKFGYLIKVN